MRSFQTAWEVWPPVQQGSLSNHSIVARNCCAICATSVSVLMPLHGSPGLTRLAHEAFSARPPPLTAGIIQSAVASDGRLTTAWVPPEARPVPNCPTCCSSSSLFSVREARPIQNVNLGSNGQQMGDCCSGDRWWKGSDRGIYISQVASPKKRPWSLLRKASMAARLSPKRNETPWPG